MPYGYITLGEMRAELLNRLQDSGAVYTTVPEANAFLIEGLRVLNAQTAAFPQDYLFDFAPVAYFVWDQEGRILEVNLAGAALLGLDRSQKETAMQKTKFLGPGKISHTHKHC